MKYKVYEYTEGDRNIVPGVTMGRDVVGFNDEGEQVFSAGLVKKNGRFLERQTGGDVEARAGIPKTDAVFLGEEEPEARKTKIKNVTTGQKKKIDDHLAEKAEKEERRLTHAATVINNMVANGTLTEGMVDQELEDRGFGKDQKEKIKGKRAEKPE